jgi:hypothetical protein
MSGRAKLIDGSPPGTGSSSLVLGDSNSRPPPEVVPGSRHAGGLTCGSLAPVVTTRARCNPLPAGTACTHRVPAGSVPSGRGRLRCSGPPRPGTDRPAGHGKADASVEWHSRLLGCDLWSQLWPTPLSRVGVGGRSPAGMTARVGGGPRAGCRAGARPSFSSRMTSRNHAAEVKVGRLSLYEVCRSQALPDRSLAVNLPRVASGTILVSFANHCNVAEPSKPTQ